jgi:hypothetical protein
VPELRYAVGHELCNRASILSAAVDLYERPDEAVGERATCELVSVAWRIEACLDTDAGV